MRPFTWIVSYPRSGNTFLRALLANAFSGLDRPLTLPEVSQSTVGEHEEALWVQLTGKPAEQRTIAEEWRQRHAYFAARRQMAPAVQRLFKSHTINAVAYGVHAFDFQPGDRIIHVVRHPCDVAMSCSDYWGLPIDQTIERMTKTSLVLNGHPRHGYEAIGSWAQHTRLWLEGAPVPIHRVRYFDLVENTVETLRGILEFIGGDADPRRAAAAAAFAQFDVLKAQEELAGFREASEVRSGRFFRVGRPLQWPAVLSPAQVEALTAPCQDILDELGFTEFVRQRLAAADA
jgi:hypothetical protein